MRALAVLSVIIYHLNKAWLPGGFLGVDLFFVLSGFLITSLLLLEVDSTGRIDLGNFFARRIRRLLPASILVLTAVVAVTWLNNNPLDQEARRPEVIAALLYIVNWQFISAGQSYFEGFVDVSPIRHYWSLAIEEQFYLVWPFTMFGLSKLSARASRWVIPATLWSASVLVMAITFEPSDPSRSYFGTDSRINQLLIGCLLAVAFTKAVRRRLTTLSTQALPLLILAVLASFVIVEDTSSYYYMGGAALFAVVVAGTIAGLEHDTRIKAALSWAPLVWIGRISYGLYLWHWPLIQWIDFGGARAVEAVVQVAATFVAATLSYYLVEVPIRRGKWLRISFDKRALVRLVPITTGAVALTTMLALSQPVPEWMTDAPVSGDTNPASTAPTTGEGGSTEEDGVVIAAVGDSVMVSLLPGLREIFGQRGWTLIEGAIPACPVGLQPLYSDDGILSPYFETRCKLAVPEARVEVLRASPDLILWHDLQSTLSRRDESGRQLLAGSDEWVTDLVEEWNLAFANFTRDGARVIFVVPPLRSQNVPGCGDSALTRCTDIQKQDERIRLASEAFVSSNSDSGLLVAVYVDHLLCPNGYPCPEQIDGIEVRLGGNDQTHFTEEGSRWFASELSGIISSLAIDPSS